jgi:hypothetical protein
VRYSQEVRDAIDYFIGDHSEIGSVELGAFVLSVIPALDKEELVRRECLKIGQQRISRIRDDTGVRVYFSDGKHANRKYINAETTTDLAAVISAHDRQQRQAEQTRKNINKLGRRAIQLAGQMSLFTDEETLSEISDNQQ